MGFRDLGTKKVLPRTKIEFSEAEPLKHKIEFYPITVELVVDIFEFQNDLLLDISFIQKIERALPGEDELIKSLYLNYIVSKSGEVPRITSQRSFSALNLANKEFQSFLTKENQSIYFSNRLVNLFVYGFYRELSIDDNPVDSKSVFLERLRVIKQCEKYAAIPYMIDKKDRFTPFATHENSLRAYKTIASIKATDDDQISLLFWGLVFIALLNEKTNPLMRQFFLELPDKNHSTTKEIFTRYNEATKGIVA